MDLGNNKYIIFNNQKIINYESLSDELKEIIGDYHYCNLPDNEIQFLELLELICNARYLHFNNEYEIIDIFIESLFDNGKFTYEMYLFLDKYNLVESEYYIHYIINIPENLTNDQIVQFCKNINECKDGRDIIMENIFNSKNKELIEYCIKEKSFCDGRSHQGELTNNYITLTKPREPKTIQLRDITNMEFITEILDNLEYVCDTRELEQKIITLKTVIYYYTFIFQFNNLKKEYFVTN